MKSLATRVSSKLEISDFKDAVRLACWEDTMAEFVPSTLNALRQKPVSQRIHCHMAINSLANRTAPTTRWRVNLFLRSWQLTVLVKDKRRPPYGTLEYRPGNETKEALPWHVVSQSTQLQSQKQTSKKQLLLMSKESFWVPSYLVLMETKEIVALVSLIRQKGQSFFHLHH